MRGVRIRGIGIEFGSLEISSDDVAARTGSPSDFRRTKLGIDRIRVSTAEETTSELAVRAVHRLFSENKELRPEQVEFLILVTQNPDFRLPTTACLVQNKAELPRNILAYDVNQGCSGYVVALAQAKALVASGMATRGLVVTSEVYNKVINPQERNTFGLFGDAATASFVEACPEGVGIQGCFFGSDGSLSDAIIVRTGGSAFPEKSGGPADFLHMDGKAVLRFVLKMLPDEIRAFLGRNSLAVADVDHWIFHQANRHMNAELCAALQIPADRAFFDIWDCGNTVSNTIPVALSRARNAGALKGRHLMLFGFGVGLSWGGCLYTMTSDNTL